MVPVFPVYNEGMHHQQIKMISESKNGSTLSQFQRSPPGVMFVFFPTEFATPTDQQNV